MFNCWSKTSIRSCTLKFSYKSYFLLRTGAVRPVLLRPEILCALRSRTHFCNFLDNSVSIINRRELLEEALRNECGERNVLSIFLHLFLSVLWTLESKVLQSGQHPSSGVDGADQLVGGSQRDSEGQVLGVVLGSQGRDYPSRSLQPANYL